MKELIIKVYNYEELSKEIQDMIIDKLSKKKGIFEEYHAEMISTYENIVSDVLTKCNIAQKDSKGNIESLVGYEINIIQDELKVELRGIEKSKTEFIANFINYELNNLEINKSYIEDVFLKGREDVFYTKDGSEIIYLN